MKKTLLNAWMIAVLSSLLVGCGASAVGEECGSTGSTDVCEDGSICTNEDATSVCRWLCTDTAECATGHSCNGVSGSNLKSCQPDKP